MTTEPHADEDRRERYAKAIRDRVRIRLGANVVALAAQGRPLKMSFSEAEIAAEAAMAVADAEQAALRRQADEAPLSPYYEHPECGFHWHGRDGMDIPMQDGQPVCPRCELAKVQKKLDYTQRRRDEVGAECKRRGKIKLEQAERIARLERQLDEVQAQLGAEILRAGQAEATLERIQRVIRRLANHAVGFQDMLDDSDRDPWAKTVGADIAGLRRLADEAQQQECTASISGSCLREAESETACDTDAGECVHGGRPAAEAPEQEPSVHGESVAHLAGLHDGRDTWADDEQDGLREETGAALARLIADHPLSEIQAAIRILGWPPLRFELVEDPEQQPADEEPAMPAPVHAIPEPGSNGISACCGRPPCEFVGERVTRDPEEVTCTQPAVDARQDGAQDRG